MTNRGQGPAEAAIPIPLALKSNSRAEGATRLTGPHR
jgi:hypothetical protein